MMMMMIFSIIIHPHINTITIIIMIIMSIIRWEVALPSLEVAAPQVLPLLYHVLPFKRWVLRIRVTELVYHRIVCCISDCFS